MAINNEPKWRSWFAWRPLPVHGFAINGWWKPPQQVWLRTVEWCNDSYSNKPLYRLPYKPRVVEEDWMARRAANLSNVRNAKWLSKLENQEYKRKLSDGNQPTE